MSLRYHDPRAFLGLPRSRSDGLEGFLPGDPIALYSDGTVSPDLTQVAAALIVAEGRVRQSFYSTRTIQVGALAGSEEGSAPSGALLSSLEAELLGIWMATEFAVRAKGGVVIHGDHRPLLSALSGLSGLSGVRGTGRGAKIPKRLKGDPMLSQVVVNLRELSGRVGLQHGNDRHEPDIRIAHDHSRAAIRGRPQGSPFEAVVLNRR
ncbi:hypothetical protein TK90_2737 (plasmid) [Thioalkalivibrio sp. K90mix]|nr:hypothetical protein TK90_2737 [Thioalkalivibrio sp. K90mix]